MKYNIRQIFAEMELDLIKSMQRNLKAHEAEEEKLGFKWEQWQKRKLEDLQRYRAESRKIVRKHSGQIETAAEQEVKGSFRRGADRVLLSIKKLWGRLGFGSGLHVPLPTPREESDTNFFRFNEKRVNRLVDAARNEMQIARAAMLRQADDVFRQTIFKSQVYLNSGAASLNQAIDMATRDFLDKGFNYIEFSDGRRMNVGSYAEMALRAASQRAMFAGEGARRQEMGVHTVVVSAHNNCSELCLPWQGKVYIDDVYSGGKPNGKYPLLSTAMAAGLFHPNCRHNMTTFVPGVSRLPAPVDDEEALANYDAEQEQRYMERQVRKYKRREAGSTDPKNQEAAKAKVKEWQKRLRGHLSQNEHLRRDSRRERVRV